MRKGTDISKTGLIYAMSRTDGKCQDRSRLLLRLKKRLKMTQQALSICFAGGLQPPRTDWTESILRPGRANQFSQTVRQSSTLISPDYRIYRSSVFYCGGTRKRIVNLAGDGKRAVTMGFQPRLALPYPSPQQSTLNPGRSIHRDSVFRSGNSGETAPCPLLPHQRWNNRDKPYPWDYCRFQAHYPKRGISGVLELSRAKIVEYRVKCLVSGPAIKTGLPPISQGPCRYALEGLL